MLYERGLSHPVGETACSGKTMYFSGFLRVSAPPRELSNAFFRLITAPILVRSERIARALAPSPACDVACRRGRRRS